MRSWFPLPPAALDNSRLLAEHNELLIMARALAGETKGWRNHPETLRWRGCSKAMKRRHDALADEMVARGMSHRTPWPAELVVEDEPDVEPLLLEHPAMLNLRLQLKLAGVEW